jgi:hypothetical protein
MEIPRRGPRPSVALPEIYVHDSNPSDRFRTSRSSSSYNSTSSPSTSSIPMSIPHSRDPVPPPLPPPRHLADIVDGRHDRPDIAWQWGNSHEDNSDWGRSIASVPPGSSLYGSASRKSFKDERSDDSRRGSSTSTIKSLNGAESRESIYPRIDEGYASLSGTSIGSNRSVLQLS